MNVKVTSIFFAVSTAVILSLGGCSWFDDLDSSSTDSGSSGGITVSPSSVTLVAGDTQQFSADGSSIEWSLSGQTGSSSINSSGLLTIGNDETASTLTVKAAERYGDKSGTAAVTVAGAGQAPSGLKVAKPGPAGIQLSWNALSGAGEYTVYRSTNGKDFSQIAKTSTVAYTDTAVGSGSSYYYRINANGVRSQSIFGFAADYFKMPAFTQRKLVPLAASTKHYYRFPVNAGGEYTIEWQDGNNQNTDDWWFRISVWQNDGALIFGDTEYHARGGYTNPLVFTAASTGFVTVEVRNGNSSTSFNYQIYCYGAGEAEDPGTVALPPYKVSDFKVTSSAADSIALTWTPVSDGVTYNIYRANTKDGAVGKIGESNGTSYQDNQVSSGNSFWYTIAAVNADGLEGCRYQGAFGFAAPHYALSPYSGAQTLSLGAGVKHYYRLAVTAGSSYTIEWQNGNNQNTDDWWFRISVWQNDGTLIFGDTEYHARGGYTNPLVFTAASTGFVTVELRNGNSSNSYNYQIYYY